MKEGVAVGVVAAIVLLALLALFCRIAWVNGYRNGAVESKQVESGQHDRVVRILQAVFEEERNKWKADAVAHGAGTWELQPDGTSKFTWSDK